MSIQSRASAFTTYLLSTGLIAFPVFAYAEELDIEAEIETELSAFHEHAELDRREDWNASFAGTLDIEYAWDDGDQSITFKPFGRIDRHDGRRSHADIRELKYQLVTDNWELRAGFDQVFWGVTEFVHVVDIINQTDFVESTDGEDKLGQPMVNISTARDFGTFDLFILPGFRERTFAGLSGRPSPTIRIEPSLARYESSAEEKHVDFALRYSHYIGDWDFGLSWFQGTGRDPILSPTLVNGSELVLVPYYAQIKQASVDVQSTKGAWLYKLEGFWRDELNEARIQAAGGIEYTFYGLFDTDNDLGIVAEYMFDDRHRKATQPFNNDIFAGLRWTANDEAGTVILAGGGRDLDTGSMAFSVEAERRLADDYFLKVESRFLTNTDDRDPLYSVRHDDLFKLTLTKYF